MTSLAVAFANIGRGTPDQTRVAVERIAKQMATFDTAALLLNEIDEADAADEHGLLSSTFGEWDKRAWDSREPILTKGVEHIYSQSIRAARGVARQSPARPVHETIIRVGKGAPIVLMGGHPPAGAKNGQRSARVKVLLVAEYLKMRRLIRRRIKHHRGKDRHVVIAMDFNWRNMPRLHRAQVELANHGPDYILAIPARGWSARRLRRGAVDLPVEKLHRLEWAVVKFSPALHQGEVKP